MEWKTLALSTEMIRKFSLKPFEIFLCIRDREISIRRHPRNFDRKVQFMFCKYCTKSYLWNFVHVTRKIQTPEQLREELDHWNSMADDDD